MIIRDLIDKTSAALAARSIGTADKLAIVLPNGPEMAAAFIAAASSCVTAPLNPAYRHDEFAFYLDDLKARALRLRDFAGSRLADFKVPRRILIVPEIPKGATGKLQRMGLAQKLGLVS